MEGCGSAVCGNARDNKTDSELARGFGEYVYPYYLQLRGAWTGSTFYFRREEDREAFVELFKGFAGEQSRKEPKLV